MPVKLKSGKSLTPRAAYNPKTAAQPSMRPALPVRSGPFTSKDAEQQVNMPPQPFANPQGVLGVPAPTHPQFRSNGNPKELNYQISKVGCADTSTTDDMLAAVGEPRKPKGYNDVNYFRGAGERRVGGGNQPSSRRGRR